MAKKISGSRKAAWKLYRHTNPKETKRDKKGVFIPLSLFRDIYIYIYILGWEMLSTGSFRTLKPSLFLIPLFASL